MPLRLSRWDRLFLLVLCVSLGLRLVFVDIPPLVTHCAEPARCNAWDLGLIFDEWYYVNAARNIIGRPMVFGYTSERTLIVNNSIPIMATRYHSVPIDEIYPNATKFTDPNTEHPPLAKLVVAFSALLLDENAVGYRLPSVVFGMLLLVSLYLAVKKLANDQVAFYAATFLSFETLTFIHSRIFMLDIFMVSLMVVGFCLYLRGYLFAAGAAIGLSALSKEIGVIGLPIVIIFGILEGVSNGRFKIRESAQLVAKVILGFTLPVVLLCGSIAIWWNVSPFQQIQNVAFLGKLKVDQYYLDGSYIGFDSAVRRFGDICPPWLWILNGNPIEYSREISGYHAGGANLIVKYLAAMNPMLIYIMLPAVAYSVWHYWSTRDRVDLFAVVWWACSYLIWYPLAFTGRVMYLFYMLPAIGAISLMAADLMCHHSMNSYVRYLYVLTVIVSMFLQFPVKLS